MFPNSFGTQRFDGLGGFNLVADPRMVTAVSFERQRTWRERLFTYPWKPWKSLTIDFSYEPMTHVYKFGGSIIGHPDIIRKIKSGDHSIAVCQKPTR